MISYSVCSDVWLRSLDLGFLIDSVWFPVFSSCTKIKVWGSSGGGGGGQTGQKHRQQATGCTWHSEEWMAGSRKWRGKEGKWDILDHSCVQIEKKKTLFWSAERHSVVLSPARWRAGGQCAAARVKRGRVSYSCSQPRSHLQALFCFWQNAMKWKPNSWSLQIKSVGFH